MKRFSSSEAQLAVDGLAWLRVLIVIFNCFLQVLSPSAVAYRSDALGWFKNAFAVDPPGPAKPTPEERDIIHRVAQAIVKRHLSVPAIMILECCHPLNFIGSQFLLFISPFATFIFNQKSYRTFVQFLEKRGSVETICRQIEDAMAEADGREKKDDSAQTEDQ